MEGPPETSVLEAVFPGEGEMARLMRARDWSETPLGPVSEWPQSLRTSVSILLKSRHPMFLWWGPELVQFYNDGYRPSLGAHKHPAALGQLGRECWEEIWPIIGQQIEGVMARGEETWHEDQLVPFDRNGFLEEIYFTYGYSPIREEGGSVGGTLVVCTETTDRVLGERRLRTLAKLSAWAGTAPRLDEACERAIEVLQDNAEDVPFALLYLVHGDETRLAGAVGLEPGSEVAPEQLQLDAADSPWPLAEAIAARAPLDVEGLERRLRKAAPGPWPETPRAARLLPLSDRGHDAPIGVLVAGLSPRLPVDERYHEFLDLVASQVSAAIAGARAYEEERRRAEALAELDRAKTAFFSNVSHEFRTPLTLTLGPIADALAQSEPRLEGETLAVVHRNAQRLLRLVNTLLDFSRIEAGRFRARYQPLDLGSVTADLASTFRSLVESSGLSFELECPALSEPVWVDRDSWEKIVLNLVSNAYKFTFDGGITVRVEERSDDVVVSVCDTGTGITADELPLVFERFHRVQGARSRSYEGSGIGLALVQELVQRHGGRIDVDSEPGEGTTFRVVLPKGRDHLPADQVQEESEAEVAPQTPSAAQRARPFVEEARRWGLGGDSPDRAVAEPEAVLPSLPTTPAAADARRDATIVIADDNADMRQYLERLLEPRWQVAPAADGIAALELVRERRPDLVVADVMMPRMDGFELLAAVRSDGRTASVPFVLLSARAGEEARVEGLAAGADDYLVKPFAAQELIARVESQLAMAELRDAARAYRDLLEDLVLQAPAAIAILRGRDLVFELANPEYQRIVGEGRAVIGRPLRECLPEVQEQGIAERMLEVLASGEPWVGRELPIELERGGEGEPELAYFDATVQRIPGIGDEPEGLAVFAFEITEMVAARQRAEELTAQVQWEAQQKDEFLAMLSHELRGPLAPMNAAVELLRRDARAISAQQRRWALEVFERQTAQLGRLVDDLLDIGRISRGAIRLQRQVTTAQKVVGTAIETVEPFIRDCGHDLQTHIPERPIRIDVDPLRTAQIVSNLLHNAAKYTPRGGRITLTVEADDDRATMVVEDDGEGIDAELLPRVFDLFAQGPRTLDRSSGGLGIGLTVVRRLVELQGGSVDAHSDGPGSGSRFVVRLPLATAAEDRDGGPTATAATADPLRILVLDNVVDAGASLGMLLELEGHETRVVQEADAALDTARLFEPDVALLDIGLPGMDGYEVARLLRREHGDKMRLIAVTGYGLPADRAKVSAAAFDDHLVKPVDFDTLREILAGVRRKPNRSDGLSA